ncbi:MAG TPA: nucleotide exchange factor GrpE [Patescibacteria group bacterium]|nr:nucleotide exchange factor GrpE [Patescibacteria group bacterium]
MTKETKDKKNNQSGELEEKYLRALADYQNLEKRVEREKDNFVKFANTVLILKMLPILDNLERAGAHLKDQGIDLVIKQFKEALSSEGVTEIRPAGSDFDPELHEAVEKVSGEEDKVIDIVQSGYKMGDKVIRPAKVTVGGKK